MAVPTFKSNAAHKNRQLARLSARMVRSLPSRPSVGAPFAAPSFPHHVAGVLGPRLETQRGPRQIILSWGYVGRDAWPSSPPALWAAGVV